MIVKVLREYDVHPAALIIREDDLNASWPNSANYIPIILDELGAQVFGKDAFPKGSEILPVAPRIALGIFVHRTWNLIRVQLGRMQKHCDKIRAQAKNAFEELETATPTKAQVTAAIAYVAKWRDAAEMFSMPADMAAAAEMLGQLQMVMEGLGVSVRQRVQTKAASRISAAALKNLASAEDVSDIAAIYHDYFENVINDDDEPPVLEVPDDRRAFNNSGGDFGVELESRLTSVQLLISLGFTGGLPPIFARHRHRTGSNAWDHPELFSNVKEDEKLGVLSKFALHWHQLAGLHSIIRSTFTVNPQPDHTSGVLVADEVGLGKTAQAIAFIAFLHMMITAQGDKRQLPKFVRDRSYLNGSDKIPSLPHIILCPATLVAQWISELKSLLIPRSVDIFAYEGVTDTAAFWSSNGPFFSSRQPLHGRIIVASHSALARDMSATHVVPKRKKKNTMPWIIPEPFKDISNSLFGQNFLVCVVDEAHAFRNINAKHLGLLRILNNSQIKLPMTATPLYTSTRDVGVMLRLVGLKHYFTPECVTEASDDLKALRRAKKLDDDGAAARAERMKTVTRLQQHSIGHFLRRTTASVDFKGNSLIPLPPYIEIIGILKISDQERLLMEKCNKNAKSIIEGSETVSPSEIKTTNFYNDYRVSIVWEKENPGDPYPTFKDLAEWQPVKTTKLDVAARVCQHYVSRDDVEDVQFVDGLPVFPVRSAVPGETISCSRRIIMFAHFSSMAAFIKNILQIYGVPCLLINGKVPVANRDKVVKDFYEDLHPARVLLISSVASAGINLSCADVVIFFDQPWSAQEERQIRGRAWRQPQSKTVKIIHLLAAESADLVMNAVAREKKDMYEHFVDKQVGENLRRIFNVTANEGDDEDLEADAYGSKANMETKKPTVINFNADNVDQDTSNRKKTQKKSTVANVVADDVNDKSKRKKKRTVKSKAFVDDDERPSDMHPHDQDPITSEGYRSMAPATNLDSISKVLSSPTSETEGDKGDPEPVIQVGRSRAILPLSDFEMRTENARLRKPSTERAVAGARRKSTILDCHSTSPPPQESVGCPPTKTARQDTTEDFFYPHMSDPADLPPHDQDPIHSEGYSSVTPATDLDPFSEVPSSRASEMEEDEEDPAPVIQ
ncbi:hypothetical protein C0991_002138, partial [Blastosporella zonata]